MRLQQYIIEKKAMKFARYGSLSKTKFKKPGTFSTFHNPPRKKGIFAFIWPYIDDFLWAWQYIDKSEEEYRKIKKRIRKTFTYSGDIWCHFVEEAMKLGYGKAYEGAWVKVHTDDLQILFKKVKHKDIKSSMAFPKEWGLKFKEPTRDPYKINPNIRISMDHLEVFIEKVN